jgi:hypothetical protein
MRPGRQRQASRSADNGRRKRQQRDDGVFPRPIIALLQRSIIRDPDEGLGRILGRGSYDPPANYD